MSPEELVFGAISAIFLLSVFVAFKKASGFLRVFGTILLLFPVFLIIGLLVVFGYFEVNKAYWDYRVTEMCESDGGIAVYEKVTISDKEYRSLGGVAGGMPLPHKDKVTKNQPYFYQTNEKKIHEWNPEVVRGETLVKRQSDGKVLGRSVHYWRRGGDFPTGLFHDSSYVCPQKNTLLSKQIFDIQEE